MAKEAGDLRRGNAIRLNGELMIVAEFSHVKPGKGPAYLQAKLRAIPSGNIREHRFRITETVEQVFTEKKKSTFSYRSGIHIIFMDEVTFEEYTLSEEMVGDSIRFYAEGETVELEFADGAVVGIAWPEYITRTVKETMQGVKSVKVTNQVKPATLDVGVEVQVPIFIKEGDRIRIQTATGKYHERVKA
ncbi:MAG: elongation factor P [Planctomycetota bacterium]